MTLPHFIFERLKYSNHLEFRYQEKFNKYLSKHLLGLISIRSKCNREIARSEQFLAYCKCISRNLQHQFDPSRLRLMKEETVTTSPHS